MSPVACCLGGLYTVASVIFLLFCGYLIQTVSYLSASCLSILMLGSVRFLLNHSYSGKDSSDIRYAELAEVSVIGTTSGFSAAI